MAWAKLDSTTLSSASDSMTTATFVSKKFIQILANVFNSGTISTVSRFNADSGSNYSSRFSENGGADATDINATVALIGSQSYTEPVFTVSYMVNISTQEKLIISFLVGQSTAGAGTAPIRNETVAKWVNTSNGVTSVTRLNQATGDMAANTNMMTLGTD